MKIKDRIINFKIFYDIYITKHFNDVAFLKAEFIISLKLLI